MVSLSIPIAANNDDAHERTDNTNFSNVAGGVNMQTGFSVLAFAFQGGFRFPNVTIPPGSVINTATISVVPTGGGADDPSLDIYLEDVDNAVDFASNAHVANRVRTTATTAWVASNIGLSRVASPDFAAAAQEVVDRAGWASGNAMVVIMAARASGGTLIVRCNEDGTASNTAILDITYTEPGGGGGAVGGRLVPDTPLITGRLIG